MLHSSLQRNLYKLSRNCNSMSQLKQILSQIPNPSPFAFNSMIQSFTNSQFPIHALTLYLHMTRTNSPAADQFTYPFVLKACSVLFAVMTGKSTHAKILQLGLSRDPYIQSSLVAMYSQFTEIDTARCLFDEITERDIVLWNSMIGGYVKCGRLDFAEELFKQMPVKNIRTYNALLGGYAKSGLVERASVFFEEMPNKDIVSWNTIIGSHARFSPPMTAIELFKLAPQKNVATWSAMISGYCRSGQFVYALQLFNEMVLDGPRPNEAILVSVLSSCAHLGALDQGVWVHRYIDRLAFEVDDWLGSSLIDMYSKCGLLRAATRVFEQLEKRDACAWTSMIYGLAIHGQSHQALSTFDEMERSKIVPNDVTFTALLCACSHAGLVEKAHEIFDNMSKIYGMSPKIEHYTCMVDVLSRASLIEEARELIKSMPMQPDVFVWGALLGGIRVHRMNGLKFEDHQVDEEIARLEPKDSGAYVLVSNIYASSDRWDDAKRMRAMMEGFGVRKNPGCSLIEVEGEVHEFLASGRLNSKSEQVYGMLDLIYRGIKVSSLT